MTGSAAPRAPALPRPAGRRALLPAMAALLVAFHILVHTGPRAATLVAGPLVAAGLVVLARRAGLSFDALGLGRRCAGRGLRYGAAAAGLVAVGYLAAAALPATRTAFHDARYQLPLAEALVTALVLIPVGTVLPEEVAFRGVIWGLGARRAGPAAATVVSSALFGAWHVLPSLRLHTANPAVGAAVGGGRWAAGLAVAGAVLFTAAAGVLLCELRRRSGSLLAPFGLHWAANALGVLTSALLVHGR